MNAGRPLAALSGVLIAAPFALAACAAIAAEASGAISPDPPSLFTNCVDSPAKSGATALASSQKANARIIYDVSVSLGLPRQAAIIAITAAMQESRLQDLPYGDADSLGLFQQRPSQGWGAPAQIMNPVYAATAFYQALIRVPGWQDLPVTAAAQDVQRSGFPGAYAQWQDLATSLADEFSGIASQCMTGNGSGVPVSGTTRLPAGFELPRGTPPAVQIAVGYAAAQLGKPYIWGGTGPAGYDCSGLVMMAYQAAGIGLPRTTFQQVNVGMPVYSLRQLQPGDLLFTAGSDGSASAPGHVGIYIGSGLVIAAPQTGQPVMVTALAGYWADSTVAIRRVV